MVKSVHNTYPNQKEQSDWHMIEIKLLSFLIDNAIKINRIKIL